MNSAALPPSIWTTGTTEVIRTGTWRAQLPAYGEAPSPCRLACPIDGRIAEWMQLARAGDWRGAWTTLTDHNPFPAVTGCVCHHPCETACNRAGHDEALSVRGLERHLGELALAEGWAFPQVPQGERLVAVVGGGPSGLSAAYQLRRRGYGVTIFEAGLDLGGLLREGIPPYRLPRALLDGEIERVLALGIEVRAGAGILRASQLLALRQHYDAVYLAVGAHSPKRLEQLDYSAPWVIDGAAYLAASNAGMAPALGKRVVTIGGGSAAMDVARSARRAGHAVSVIALESEAQMPAQREEVVQAAAEGVRLFDGAMLRSASLTAQGVRLHCLRVNVESLEPLRVKPVLNSDFFVEADAVIPAIGQDADLGMLSTLLHVDGGLICTDDRRATTLPGVFAGGDAASRARFVSHAIGMGREAALEIDGWLTGKRPARKSAQPPVSLAAINTAYHPHARRQPILSEEQALDEAARCFSCGRCTLCDNCLQYCPDMAVRRTAEGYAIALEYCKGCGLCVRECPTGSISMIEDAK